MKKSAATVVRVLRPLLPLQATEPAGDPGDGRTMVTVRFTRPASDSLWQFIRLRVEPR